MAAVEVIASMADGSKTVVLASANWQGGEMAAVAACAKRAGPNSSAVLTIASLAQHQTAGMGTGQKWKLGNRLDATGDASGQAMSNLLASQMMTDKMAKPAKGNHGPTTPAKKKITTDKPNKVNGSLRLPLKSETPMPTSNDARTTRPMGEKTVELD